MSAAGLLDALKGINGGYEIQRVLGAFGTVVYIVAAPAFVVAGLIENVSLTEFSLAYPAGLVSCIGGAALSTGWKDNKVAEAKRTEAGARATDASTADRIAATEKGRA